MMWFNKWFNEDYLKIYSHRSIDEAYDQVHALVNLVNIPVSSSVLDLGCGTGRHSIAFATLGYSVIGVDLSETLIARAEERLKETAVMPVQFLIQNMFHLDDLGQFDLIVNLFTSFGYFDSDVENSRIFAVVYKHLKPDGYFILDYLHPYQVITDLNPNEMRVIDGENIYITRSVKDDSVIKTISFPERSYQEQVKLYSCQQIKKMLDENGLCTVSVYNDYQGNPWKERGDRQLFVCKRKGE